jgi:8-amino-3,8-dideoxy-alpha-D-manno-octulosonate transaminase
MPGYEMIGSEEFAQLQHIFDNGGVLFRHGFDDRRNDIYKVAEFEAAFARSQGVHDALAVTSGTAALRVALAALDVKPGSEVILPAFTFVATAEAVIEAGAVPVCVDIDETLNMDPQALGQAITEQTSAVIAVHMLGCPARLPELLTICDEKNVPLIEDTAWGCGGNLWGRPLGTWGRMGTFSFDFAKTMTTGEGGAIVFSDQADADVARAWHDHGHENNPKVPRWEDTRKSSGFNYRMTELQGAVGLAQLEKLSAVVKGQRESHERIEDALGDISEIRMRREPDGAFSTCDALVFQAPNPSVAKSIRDSLVEAGGGTKILPEAVTWHFAAHWSHMPSLANRYNGNLRSSFPASEEILNRSVALPISAVGSGLRPEKIREVVMAAVRST